MIQVIRFFALIFFFINFQVVQAQRLTIEAPSSDPTLVVRGPELQLDAIDHFDPTKPMLLSSKYADTLAKQSVLFTGLIFNKELKILSNPIKQKIELTEQLFFVGVADDNENAVFFDGNFKLSDLVKFRLDDQIIALGVLFQETDLLLLTDQYQTVDTASVFIKGLIKNFDPDSQLSLSVNGKVIFEQTKVPQFAFNYPLKEGANFLKVQLHSKSKSYGEQDVIVFYKTSKSEKKRVVLWVEQFPNAKNLTSDLIMDSILNLAKQAGFTMAVLDVKGPEGYASYRKNNLSKTPYLTATKNPNKQTEDTGFDLLESFVKNCKKNDLEVFVSFNFFTEGNITSQDFAVLDQHPDWMEVIQHPADKGRILPLDQSQIGQDAKDGKRLALAFVNPLRKDVQDFQLLRVQEVLQNYAIDGIVLDRTRYDNQYADFSSLSKKHFASYLQKQGKKLSVFPDDAFKITSDEVLQKGKHYLEWINFRSKTIQLFSKRVRNLVDSYNKKHNKSVELAAYVGSWYEYYYQNGVNWASDQFVYNPALNFPEAELYTPTYAKTSYLSCLDFLMIGTYYKTELEIRKYTTIGNILTKEQLPLVASISLPDLPDPSRQSVFNEAIKSSSGIMIFDLCYIKWPDLMEQLKLSPVKLELNKAR